MYLGYYDCYSGHLNNVATCRSDTSEKCISIVIIIIIIIVFTLYVQLQVK